jgi:hypothetical protein
VSCGETLHHFRTEIAVVDGGGVTAEDSPSGASASGWNYQNRGEDH